MTGLRPIRRRLAWSALSLALLLVAVPGCSKSSPAKPTVKVLLIGDSIMKQGGAFVGDELRSMPGVDNVEVRNEGRNGTGPLTPHLFDWYAATKRYLAEQHPDIVVVLFVGNYTSTDLYRDRNGVLVEPYGSDFFRAWEYETRRIVQLAAGSGADVYLVDPPPMITAEGQRRVSLFRAINRQIAQDYTNTVIINGTKVLSDSSGNFALSLPNSDGQMVQVRTFDTVHLTEAGARILATEIARQIAPSVLVAQRRAQQRTAG
jgi:hypothetical protein